MRAKKQLGQHWLVAPGIIKKICETPPADAPVIEIGPGTGRLTQMLTQKNRPVLLVEKDPELAEHLGQTFKDLKNVSLINADALEFDFTPYLQTHRWIVSNLPYNVGTSILTRLLRIFPAGTELVLMFQKEVADRINAKIKSKAYGSLSVYCQSLCEIKKVCDVPPGAFLPPPEVDSTVLHLKIKNPKIDANVLLMMEKICQKAFGQRRKMLRQSLKALFTPEQITHLLTDICEATARPEAISPEQWLIVATREIARQN